MHIEAITVCVGYGDFLAVTLPENLPLLDGLVVVTSPDDQETQAACRRHSVPCVLSEDHRRYVQPFNKARLINRALDQIGGRDWILHFDADIVLPQKLRRLLEWAQLDERCLYGFDRQNLVGFDRWQKLKQFAGAWDNHGHESGHWFHPEL